MQIIKDAFLGRLGLGFTFWVLGFLASAAVSALTYFAVASATQFVNQPVIYNLLVHGSSAFAIAWSLLVCWAIINASTYNRERGVWGWIATVLAVLGILRAVYSAAVLVGVAPMTFRAVEQSVAVERLGLPVTLEQGLTLQTMTTDRSERSLTYVYGIDMPSIGAENFDSASAKQAALEGCVDLKPWLSGPVLKVIMKWEAKDGSSVVVEILPTDCGF